MKLALHIDSRITLHFNTKKERGKGKKCQIVNID